MRLAGQVFMAALAFACSGMLYGDSGDSLLAQASAGSASSGSPTTNSASPKPAAKKDAKAKTAPAITPEREAAVLTFVQRNHAELAELLSYLRTSQPEEYDRAVRELFRTTERLGQVQERDPLQYDLEVAAWTAQSRVQVLAAKLKMGSSDELIKQLREALGAQNESKLALLKHERKKVADRLGKIDADIVRFESDRDNVIDRQLKLLTRAVAEDRPVKVGAKAAAKSVKKKP